MNRLFALTIIAICLSFSTASHAQDQTLQMCGIPEESLTAGDPEAACNIYTRQFAYREKRIELRQKLDERRKAFIAPSLEIYKQYDQEMAALNDSRNADNDIAGW